MLFTKRSLASFAALMMAIQGSAAPTVNPTRLMVDLSAKPDAVMLSAFDLCIVDCDADVNLEAQQALGNKMLARLNVFEVKVNSAAATAARSVGVPLLESPRAGWLRLDATHPHWIPLVTYEMAQATAERGFDGFVLTGLETISQDAERAACLQVIAKLDQVYPDKQLIIEGGMDMLPEARRALEGVLFLGNPDTAFQLDERIRAVKRLGMRPLVVDCASADMSPQERVKRTQHFRALGALPFFTTPELKGTYLGPLQEVIRRVLVIHSGAPADTFTAKVLQGSLEWLGYQVQYLDAGSSERLTTERLSAPASAVILDSTWQPLPQQQGVLLAAAGRWVANHVPLLLTTVPWGTREEFDAWAHLLGLAGTGQSVAAESSAMLQHIEKAWLQESGAVRPRTRGFRDLQAPHGARVLCSVNGGATFDQVFLASWGGAWLDAMAPLAGPQLQPLPFLDSLLGHTPKVPVMDMTAQNGRRLLIPQISSEGFTTQTCLQGLPIAAEAMTARILSHYSLPFTVALCEGDLRGTNPGLDARDSLRYETAARTLLALPQVHAASASRTRPTDWATCEEMEREIAGSMAYIHRQLLPAGDHMELMLWPEGAPPTPAAVAFSRRMGVENVQPLSQSTLPGRTPVPAAVTFGKAGTHRIVAPSVRRPGPLNATSFIAQAEAENAGRWMSASHVSLNFDDATSEASLWETERVMDWCAAQPMHAMSTRDYALLVRDAVQTRLFEQGPGHWIIVNTGHARTLRLPANAGLPDLDRSIGIAGYTVRGQDLYIHTLGRRRTELVLSAEGSPSHLRLASSSGGVRYLEAGHHQALLQVADLRPVQLAFEGIRPDAVCQISTTEQPQFIMADARGRLEVTVPAQTTVRLQVLPVQHSAMR